MERRTKASMAKTTSIRCATPVQRCSDWAMAFRPETTADGLPSLEGGADLSPARVFFSGVAGDGGFSGRLLTVLLIIIIGMDSDESCKLYGGPHPPLFMQPYRGLNLPF